CGFNINSLTNKNLIGVSEVNNVNNSNDLLNVSSDNNNNNNNNNNNHRRFNLLDGLNIKTTNNDFKCSLKKLGISFNVENKGY
ncbi:hypothetical protein TWF506_004809, partial [Arthrobotrys conoides]